MTTIADVRINHYQQITSAVQGLTREARIAFAVDCARQAAANGWYAYPDAVVEGAAGDGRFDTSTLGSVWETVQYSQHAIAACHGTGLRSSDVTGSDREVRRQFALLGVAWEAPAVALYPDADKPYAEALHAP
jgi:hypothetical protein